jgi:hypothetical protein
LARRRVVGFYTDKRKKVRPITAPTGRRFRVRRLETRVVKGRPVTRSEHAWKMDERRKAKNVTEDVEKWSKRPNRLDMPGVDTPAEKAEGKVKIVEVKDTEEQRRVEAEALREAGFHRVEIADWFIQKNQLAFMTFWGLKENARYARVVRETEKAYLLEFPRLESFSREESVEKLASDEKYTILSAVKNKKYNMIWVWKTTHRDTMWIPKKAVRFSN